MKDAPQSPGKRASLDDAPAPPELRIRRSLGGVVASRDAESGDSGPGAASGGGAIPGMGGPNAIGTRAMAAERALGDLAQVMPDPAPLTDIVARLRAAVVAALQSAGSPQPPQGAGGGLSGIVAPPALIAPPAMTGPGMPAPPPQ